MFIVLHLYINPQLFLRWGAQQRLGDVFVSIELREVELCEVVFLFIAVSAAVVRSKAVNTCRHQRAFLHVGWRPASCFLDLYVFDLGLLDWDLVFACVKVFDAGAMGRLNTASSTLILGTYWQ